MKKIAYSFIVGMVLLVQKVSAYSLGSQFGQLFDSVVTDSHFTILESVTPIYYYDLTEKQHQGGLVSGFYKLGNGFATFDAGWVDSIQDTTQKGGVILGGSVHAPELASVFIPETVKYLKSILPDTAQKFANALNFGLSFKHNLERDAFTVGFYSGIDLKF